MQATDSADSCLTHSLQEACLQAVLYKITSRQTSHHHTAGIQHQAHMFAGLHAYPQRSATAGSQCA